MFLVAFVASGSAAPPTCSAGPPKNGTGCTMTHYGQPHAADADACCALCAADAKCAAWTYHATERHSCYLSDAVDCRRVAGAVAGCKPPCKHSGPPSPPSPPPPGPPPPVPFPNFCKGKGVKCKNILYFVADDMRSDWGTYGLPVVTPNLDALAKKAMLFEHAYCQISVCAPSRMSFMTSKRPDTNRVWNFIDTNPVSTQATPGHFRDHGYVSYPLCSPLAPTGPALLPLGSPWLSPAATATFQITLGLGKTFHQASGAWNAEKYWSLDERPYYPYGVGKCPHGGQGGGHCVQKDDQIYDWHLRLQTIEYLQYATNESKHSGRPFYVMAGFRKPHAPWQAPQRMYLARLASVCVRIPHTGHRLPDDLPPELTAFSFDCAHKCMAEGNGLSSGGWVGTTSTTSRRSPCRSTRPSRRGRR